MSGGEIKGAWQAGVIESALNSGFTPDIITGISVGSLNAAFLAANWVPSNPSYVGKQLTAWWEREATSPSKFVKKRKWYELAYRILFKKWDGMVSTEPLQKMIREMFQHTFWSTSVRTAVGTVNMNTGELEYIEPMSPDFIDAVLGSAAEPIVLPIIPIHGQPFYDGGLKDIAPLAQAIKMGATEIVAVVCQPAAISATQMNTGDLMAVVNRVVGVMTNEIVQNDLARADLINQLLAELPADVLAHPYFANKKHLDVKVIRPDHEIAVHLDSFKHDEILAMVQQGRDAWK